MEILLAQYQTAIDLYKHEDDLNWSKLNNMIYANAGLLAVFGFVYSSAAPLDLMGKIVLLLPSIMGIAVSIGFRTSIQSGVDYLLKRKAAVVRMEKSLEAEGGTFIVHEPDADPISPTARVLRVSPWVSFYLWVGILILSVVMIALGA